MPRIQVDLQLIRLQEIIICNSIHVCDITGAPEEHGHRGPQFLQKTFLAVVDDPGVQKNSQLDSIIVIAGRVTAASSSAVLDVEMQFLAAEYAKSYPPFEPTARLSCSGNMLQINVPVLGSSTTHHPVDRLR
jgi:hypothetical protein